MRFQHSIALVALLPSGLCDPFHGKHDALVIDAVAARAAEPLSAVPRANSQTPPYFVVTDFNTYLQRTGSPSRWSGCKFNVQYMHPQQNQRWTAKCIKLVNDTLCDGQRWYNCTLPPDMNPQESLMFRLGKDMENVDLKWHWTYEGQWFDTISSQPCSWVQKKNEKDSNGNMTMNVETISYDKPEDWVFTETSAVG
ncbi:hypothetical protein E8E13_008656 [Curvularia kusanoi]|uniref:Uncharacterized protein n=1 Tax=Curvularia kusanoi TaxID=90978 RepID=A0A9P4WCB1_CURKU|nr:hypothetical protein E8E13_008656 [Curvularia kusanoi]